MKDPLPIFLRQVWTFSEEMGGESIAPALGKLDWG